MKRASLATAAIAALAACNAHALDPYDNYLEGGVAHTWADLDIDGLTTLSSDGFGATARGRLFLEGRAFLRGDTIAAFTSGNESGVDYDLDVQLHRLGLGASTFAGEGNIAASFWVEGVYGETDVSSDAADVSGSDDDFGGAAQVRFERADDNGIYLPYIQLGYIALGEANGPEFRIGTHVNLGSTLFPYLEVQVQDLDFDGFQLTPVTLNIGARFTL
jgi:hypothetical protein